MFCYLVTSESPALPAGITPSAVHRLPLHTPERACGEELTHAYAPERLILRPHHRRGRPPGALPIRTASSGLPDIRPRHRPPRTEGAQIMRKALPRLLTGAAL